MAVVAALLFLISCAIAVAVSPDKLLALTHASLLVSGLFMAWVLAMAARRLARRPVLGMTGVLCAWLAGLLCLYAAITHDQIIALPWTLGEAVNANVLASGLVILIPLGVGGVGYLMGKPTVYYVPFMVLTVGSLLLAGVSLIFTDSRGGMLGLSVGALIGGWISVRRQVKVRPGVRHALDGLALAVPIVLSLGTLMTMLIPSFNAFPLVAGEIAESTGSRASIWRDSLILASDYRFTGVGFGATMMALSTYVYLLHVGFLEHAHNFLEQMVVEQGVFGLIGYLFLVASAAWALTRAYKRRTVPRWLVGAIAASQIATLVHGLLDASPYVSRQAPWLAPLIFLPMGFAWGAAPPAPALRTLTPVQLAGRSLALLSPLLVGLLIVAWPGNRAAFQANLGAVEQSSRELAVYSWPTWGIQDELRRSPSVNLDGAIARYQAALVSDPKNVTANRRLGQIALSRGDLAAAEHYLAEAYRLAPQERSTRLMYGEVLALQGQAQQAADLWRTVDAAQGELAGREWWIGQVGTPEQQAAFARALALHKQP